MRGKVTVQQIADLAGVSKFAVSRALSGKPGVSEHTKEIILKAAGQLGYFKNKTSHYPRDSAEQEGGKLQGTIVVLFPNIRFQNKGSVYWGPLFEGISERLTQKGLDVITLTEPSGDPVFSLLKPAIRGIITVGAISTQILLDLKQLDIDVVMVDHVDPVFHCDTVFADNFITMKDMVSGLIANGFRSFQFIGDTRYAPSFMERYMAYRSVLEDNGIEYRQIPTLVRHEQDMLKKVVAEIPEEELPEVFVSANDMVAASVIEVLTERGIAVPGRCAVTGFDNTHETNPPLTTVNVHKEYMGMRAVDLMLWRIQNRGAPFERTSIYADIVMRESTDRI